MKRGVCPKCQGREIKANRVQRTGATQLLCRRCGYLETYILDPDRREELSAQWEPWEPPARPAPRIVSGPPPPPSPARARQLLRREVSEEEQASGQRFMIISTVIVALVLLGIFGALAAVLILRL